MNLRLASVSPRRRALLTELGLPFTAGASEVDETLRPGEAPGPYVRRLAAEKALAGATGIPPGTLTLAADTTVVLDDTVLGKPADADQAAAMLRALREQPHRVLTGVALARPEPVGQAGDSGPVTTVACHATPVRMRPYTDAEIAAYIATGDPFDKAGAYAIQHAGFAPVAAIAGCYTNVVGLPLCTVARLLTGAGMALPADAAGAVRPDAAGVCARCRAWQVGPGGNVRST